MLTKIALALVTSGLLLTSLPASAKPDTDSAFPKDNSKDYSINVAMSDADSPFPEDNSRDYSINVAMSDADSPFPKDNSKDYGTDRGINIAA